MIDSLVTILEHISGWQEEQILSTLDLRANDYALVTLHRPSNVDTADSLSDILACLNRLSEKTTMVFPMHPRTRKNIDRFGIKLRFNDAFRIIEPVRYRQFVTLQKNAQFVLTDSGGIQEETTYLKRPCLTLRPNTERPITVRQGTNELVDVTGLEGRSERILSGHWKKGNVPPLWDGRTAGRIVAAISQFESSRGRAKECPGAGTGVAVASRRSAVRPLHAKDRILSKVGCDR
jgi:UDP-N-acetylglucosamine 2-epimerase (non-hydrolysing)